MLRMGVGSVAEVGLGQRWQAIVELAVALARTPSAATLHHLTSLRELGLSELEAARHHPGDGVLLLGQPTDADAGGAALSAQVTA